jgi:hypothetical protein
MHEIGWRGAGATAMLRWSERLQIWGDFGFEDWNGYGRREKMHFATEMGALESLKEAPTAHSRNSRQTYEEKHRVENKLK